MAIVLSYKFNTDSLITDSSVTSLDLTNSGVTSIVDETYGKVANFDGSSYLSLPSGSTPTSMSGSNSRSISLWLKLDSSSLGTLRFLYSFGDGTSNNIGSRWRLQHRTSGVAVQALAGQDSEDAITPFTADTWFHMVNVFDSSDNSVKIYINGSLESNVIKSVNTVENGLVIGGDVESPPGVSIIGRMTDFRVYDDVLSDSEVSTVFTIGPEVGSITPTMYSHAANLVWDPVSGASNYTLLTSNTSGIVDTKITTNTEENVYNLDDGSSYDFELFSDLDTINPTYTSLSNLTPSVDMASTSDLITFVSSDLTKINETNISEIDPFIKDNLSTGDKIKARVSFKTSIHKDQTLTFVQESEEISIEDSPLILTPFVSTIIATDVTLRFSDGSTTETVSFDESANNITFQTSGLKNIGDTFILDGKKVRISELN